MCRVSPLVCRVLLLAAAGGLSGPGAARGQGCPCGTAADEFRAADVGLVREWIVQVPFGTTSSKLGSVVVGDGLVVARSEDGSIHAIRSASTGTASPPAGPPAGTLAWSQNVAAAAGHAWPPTIGKTLVLLSSELAVHALDRDTGIVDWERASPGLTAAPAVQSGGWVYVPLRTHRLLRLPANPRGGPVAAEPAAPPPGAGRGRKPAGPPLPPESIDPLSIDMGGPLDVAPQTLRTGVLWGSGNGIAALERTPAGWTRHGLPESSPPTWVRRTELDLSGAPVIRETPAADGRTTPAAAGKNAPAAVPVAIYIATSSGGLARIDLDAPKRPGLRTTWAVALPDRASSGPLVSGDAVVVALGPSGLVACSAADGHEIWRTDLVGTPVATAGGRVWVIDVMGRLTAVDLATGSRRQSLCLGCFTLPVINTLSERLVLASPSGLVAALAPPPQPQRPVNAGGGRQPAGGPADPVATPR